MQAASLPERDGPLEARRSNIRLAAMFLEFLEYCTRHVLRLLLYYNYIISSALVRVFKREVRDNRLVFVIYSFVIYYVFVLVHVQYVVMYPYVQSMYEYILCISVCVCVCVRVSE